MPDNRCVNCHAENTLFIGQGALLSCRLCGHQQALQMDERAQQTEKMSGYQPAMSPQYVTLRSHWAKAKYTSAMSYIRQGKYDEARESLQAAMELHQPLIDGYLWMARIADNDDDKRNYYGRFAAYVPDDIEAMTELMILNGEIERDNLNVGDTDRQQADVPAEAHIIEFACDTCGSSLRSPADKTRILCQNCGNEQRLKRQKRRGERLMRQEQVKEKAQGVIWDVGAHFLHCNYCGSERIATESTLSGECPFCHSTQVITSDVLNSFRQPDGIILFELDEAAARTAIEAHLDNLRERFIGFFSENRVKRIDLTRTYIPFWVFDVLANVTRIIEEQDYSGYSHQMRTSFRDAGFNIFEASVTTPPRSMLNQIGRYDAAQSVPYDPRHIVGIPTELYSVDYAQAAARIKRAYVKHLNQKHDRSVNTRVNSRVKQVTFRLLLCPVWIGDLTEVDGDKRLAVVNGQTGAVTLRTNQLEKMKER